MKPTDFIKEEHNLVQAATEMHTDHEIQMAREACYRSASNAIELHRMLKHISEQEGLQAWASEKISLANDYLRAVKEWLEYELMSRLEGRVAENNMDIVEGTKETSTGRVHKSEPGGYGRRDDEDEDKKKDKKAEPEVKRGRGRPKKDSDSETGEVKKWDTAALSGVFGGSVPKKLPGKVSVKHKIKDEPDEKLDENDSEAQLRRDFDDVVQKVKREWEAKRAKERQGMGPKYAPEQSRAELERRLRELESEFDPAYQYSDDYSFWTKQNAIAREIASINKKLGSQGVAEATGNTGLPHDFTAVQPGAEVWYKGRFAGWTTGKVYDDPYGKAGKMVAFEPNPSEFPGDDGRILSLPYDEVSLRKSTSIGKLKGQEQGVAEGSILKSIRRGLQGWGTGDAPTPQELVRQNKGYSDDDIKALARDTRKINPHSPGGLQKRVVDREMKKRGLGEEGVAEGGFDDASPMTKDTVKADRIRSLKNLIAIAKEQGRQLRVQELELELKKLQGVAEGTKETSTGRVHKAEPGGYGRRDDESEDKKKTEPAVKRGRGRPKKDADSDTGEVKKWDTDTLQRWIVGSVPKKLPGKASVKHKIKDEPDDKMDESMRRKQTKEMASAGASSAGGFAVAPTAKKKIIKR